MPIAYAGFPFLTAILLSCLVGLLVILFIPAHRKTLIRWTSAVFSGIALLFSVYLFIAYDRSQGGLQFVEKILWVQSVGIHYFNGADGFNLPLLLLTGLVHFTGSTDHVETGGKGQRIFCPFFPAGLGRLWIFHEPGSFFHLRLV